MLRMMNSDLSMDRAQAVHDRAQRAPGEVLVDKDEEAEDMLYIVSGVMVEPASSCPGGRHRRRLGMLSLNMRTRRWKRVEVV